MHIYTKSDEQNKGLLTLLSLLLGLSIQFPKIVKNSPYSLLPVLPNPNKTQNLTTLLENIYFSISGNFAKHFFHDFHQQVRQNFIPLREYAALEEMLIGRNLLIIKNELIEFAT